MNEHGLAMVQTAGPGMLDQGPGLAGCLLPRIVLERARTVAEAIDVLRGDLPDPDSASSTCSPTPAATRRSSRRSTTAQSFVHARRGSWAVNRFVADELQEVIVEIPIAGLGESNSVRCTAFDALGPALPATRDELVQTLRTPPIHQDGLGGLYSVHTAVYTPREASVLVARSGINEPFRQYGVTESRDAEALTQSSARTRRRDRRRPRWPSRCTSRDADSLGRQRDDERLAAHAPPAAQLGPERHGRA